MFKIFQFFFKSVQNFKTTSRKAWKNIQNVQKFKKQFKNEQNLTLFEVYFSLNFIGHVHRCFDFYHSAVLCPSVYFSIKNGVFSRPSLIINNIIFFLFWLAYHQIFDTFQDLWHSWVVFLTCEFSCLAQLFPKNSPNHTKVITQPSVWTKRARCWVPFVGR